jgi:hypothetical protein
VSDTRQPLVDSLNAPEASASENCCLFCCHAS